MEAVLAAFADAIQYYHGQLDREVVDPNGRITDPPRTYFEDERGWTPEIICEKRLGWAPVDNTALYYHLIDRGHSHEAILGTGLFYPGDEKDDTPVPHFRGRYVFPYFDTDGRPVYAISRTANHPTDPKVEQKYTKAQKNPEYAEVSEPIYGLQTISTGNPVLITEGIADAITAHQFGYPCISPVTKQFKQQHFEPLLDALREHDVPRVYIVQDAEVPTSDVTVTDGPVEQIGTALTVEQYGSGEMGAIRTAAALDAMADWPLEVRLGSLPRPGLDKVDLDLYLQEWADGDLSAVLRSARPAEEHRAYSEAVKGMQGKRHATSQIQARQVPSRDPVVGGEGSEDGDRIEAATALDGDVSMADVTGKPPGYRGPNPLGHHGDSTDYFVDYGTTARDFKYGVSYSPWTYLLCEAGARHPSDPEGPLSDEELWIAWRYAKETGVVPEDDPIPSRALAHVAVKAGLCDAEDVEEGRLPDGIYGDALDAVEDQGVDHGRGSGDGEHVSLVPTETLERLLSRGSLDTAAKAAKRRGFDWPDEAEVRRRTGDTIEAIVASEGAEVVRSPTSSGKSYKVATTPWRADRFEDITGGQPVVQLHHNTATRDAKYRESIEAGVDARKTLGAHEACSVCAGEHDDEVIIDGQPASEWFAEMREKGVPFSLAHTAAFERNDEWLPCCGDDEQRCRGKAQWENIPRDDDGTPTVDVIHATHPFLYVPSLSANTNVVLDEQPDFTLHMDNDRARRAVSAFLDEVDALLPSYERLVAVASEGFLPYEHGPSPGEKYDRMQDALHRTPDRDWFLGCPEAHFFAPGIARAIWYAARDDADRNGRRSATVAYHPPRLDADDGDDEGWNRVWINVVLKGDDIQQIRASPDLAQARSVVGLDAFPDPYEWQRHVHPDITIERILSPREEQLYTLFERRQVNIQVGDARLPVTSDRAVEQWLPRDRLRTEIASILEASPDIRAAITSKNAEEPVRDLLNEAGVPEDEIRSMHFGEDLGRDDFGDEPGGIVVGAHDLGDGPVVDRLAELELDAEPERSDVPCDQCGNPNADDSEPGTGCWRCDGTGWKRARGRGFEGPDAEAAEAILQTFTQGHAVQAGGRFARGDRDPESDPVPVFYFTNSLPPGFAHVSITGAEWVYGPKQRAVADYLAEHYRGTAPAIGEAIREAAEDGDYDFTYVTDEHVRQTLRRFEDRDFLRSYEGIGPNGATLYLLTGPGRSSLSGAAEFGIGDTTLEQFAQLGHSGDVLANRAVRGPNTSQLGSAPGADVIPALSETGGAGRQGSAPPVDERGVPPPE